MPARSLGVLALTALALAACGGSTATRSRSAPASGQTFQSQLAVVEQELREAGNAIGAAIVKAPAQNNFQIASAFTALARSWLPPLEVLGKLVPPAGVSAEFARLRAAASRVETDLKAIAAAAQKGRGSAARRASTGLVRSIARGEAASTRIDRRLGIGSLPG